MLVDGVRAERTTVGIEEFIEPTEVCVPSPSLLLSWFEGCSEKVRPRVRKRLREQDVVPEIIPLASRVCVVETLVGKGVVLSTFG